MTNRWLTLVEAHVEKGILFLAGVALLFMLWTYGVNTPNTVAYQNQELEPSKLAQVIKSDAEDLQRRMRTQDMEVEEPKKFSKELADQHEAGIFAKSEEGAPALAAELRLATNPGPKIVVPGLKETESANSISVVTPLKPSQPKLRTGRSLALREQYQVAGLEEQATPAPDGKVDAEEVAWVSVAAYFDKKAQYTEMINAGYAPYRSKAYVVGLDVERQEVLSTGEYSAWKPVTVDKAMPKLDLPLPVFEDETNALAGASKEEIRQAFATIKLAQTDLMQPPFYAVQGGDFWEIPPLAGYQDEDEEEGEEEEDVAIARGRAAGAAPIGRAPVIAGGRGGPPISIGGGGRAGGGGARGGGARGGGGGGRTSGGYNPAAGGGAQSDAEQKREARKEIRESLSEARKLLGQKEYNEARGIAERVISNQYASKGDARKAKELLRTAERWLKLEEERAGGGRRTFGRDEAEIVTNPETHTPAVWFHDDTVEAGKTYRYRMRVKLWNRYVGRMRAVKNPEDAKQPTIAGEWSLPSEPVTVTPSTYFFFTGSRPADAIASTDVWKWRKGRWVKERFDVSVGDVIGGVINKKTGEYDEKGEEVKADVDFTTGAVVLDLRFDEEIEDRWPGKDGVFSYRDKKSAVMVYLDPADGQVKEKVLLYDRNDPKHKALKESAW